MDGRNKKKGPTRRGIASDGEGRQPKPGLQLASAPPGLLEDALKNPQLTTADILLVLRNPSVTSQILGKIGTNKRWTADYQVKKGLIRHPQTPRPLASRLVPHLFWKDLADTAEDPRLTPGLRHRAEEMLENRVGELALGEQIALGRRGGRRIIERLLESTEPGVTESLLGNPRLIERDAVTIASRENPHSRTLGHLARHAKWGHRRAVRLALVANPATRVQIALKLVGQLHLEDLRHLIDDIDLPRIIQVSAERERQRRLGETTETEQDGNTPRTG
jgi:hypothetical protein